MKPFSVKSLVLVIGIAALSCGVLAGPAGAQGTMPPGSYTCQPLSEENFLEPPPIQPADGLTPEEQDYADSAKLPPDLCPPGMIAYPVPISGDIAHPGTPAKGSPRDVVKPADSVAKKAKAKKAKAKRAKAKRAKAKARHKKAKAKKRRLAKAKAKSASRR